MQYSLHLISFIVFRILQFGEIQLFLEVFQVTLAHLDRSDIDAFRKPGLCNDLLHWVKLLAVAVVFTILPPAYIISSVGVDLAAPTVLLAILELTFINANSLNISANSIGDTILINLANIDSIVVNGLNRKLKMLFSSIGYQG